MPDPPWPIVLSCLRFGADAQAARLLKDVLGGGADPGPGLIDKLFDALAIPQEARSEQFEKARHYASAGLARANANGLLAVPWFADDYPPALREIVDPPIVLWRAGRADVLAQPSIAIVGSRDATPAGVAIARRLAHGLASVGFVIVSGLARGIDAAAHEGALAAGGATVGVLGCGADVVYPRQNAALTSRVRDAGALVSEFLPGTDPRPHHFPLRNRIISGLSRAVILAQASMKSGSLITARMALEQGREVLAVPGTVTSGQFAGGHALIKDGAPLVETVEDVLRALGVTLEDREAGGPGVLQHDNSMTVSKLQAAMAVGETYTADQLAERTGLAGPELLAQLGALEVAGLIGRVPGAGFVKFDKSAIGEWHG